MLQSMKMILATKNTLWGISLKNF